MGQQTKNDPPATNQKIFMQKAMSVKRLIARQLAKKIREAVVFRGYVQAWKLEKQLVRKKLR